LRGCGREEREEMEEQVFRDGGWTVSDAIDRILFS